MSWPSGVSVIWPAVAGTRLMQTRTSMGARSQLRTRVFCGSKSGVGPTTATVAGYCSPKYSTASLVPAFACSGGRKLIRIVLPTDGPDPALVTYDPRPCRHQARSEEHTSELQSHSDLVCRLLLEKKKQ